MLLDISDLDDSFRLQADVAIVGAGAAGIAMARELAGSSISVVVLESGGFELEAATQTLYRGKSVGREYFPLTACRLRFFGGSTNHWGNELGMLDDHVMAPRDWVPASGWPVTAADLAPYYQRALPACLRRSRTADVYSALARRRPAFDSTDLGIKERRRHTRGSSLKFGVEYRRLLEQASNVRVVLHANVTEIATASSGGHVTHLEVRSLGGRHGRVEARAYVLAVGGLENPRLLLASNRVARRGLGNGRDLVGRYFMEHLHLRPAIALGPRPALQSIRIAFNGRLGSRFPALSPSYEFQRAQRILDFGAHFHYGRKLGVNEEESVGEAVPEAHGARAIWELEQRGEPAEACLDSILLQQEQAPDPGSRVYLEGERDALGMPRLVLDLRLGELERRTAHIALATVARELGRLGRGQLRVESWIEEAVELWDGHWMGGSHHMGTTRMASDPARGVVDRNARLFDVDNLWIAGSSLFPTGGYVNPTLTLVALAIRLSDHLREALA